MKNTHESVNTHIRLIISVTNTSWTLAQLQGWTWLGCPGNEGKTNTQTHGQALGEPSAPRRLSVFIIQSWTDQRLCIQLNKAVGLLLPDNKGAEFMVYSWIKATSLAVSEGQQSSDSKYLGVGRVWRTFSVHHQSPHLGPPWHSYAYVNSTDSRRASSSSLQTPARMTEKEKRLVLVHGFRGFSPWAASSITSGLGKAEHHGGRREERRRLFVSRWSGGKEEEDGIKDKTHLLSGALLQWPFSN